MYYINSNAGELFYLRYLLLNVSNSIFFENLRTINDNIIFSFYDIYTTRGLLYNDAKWDQILKEADVWQSEECLRSLFVMILLNCELSDSLNLWNKHKERYVD